MVENILIRRVERNDMSEVVEMLQSISSFLPPEASFDEIWKAFASQNNVYSLVAEDCGTLVGYGSIVIEVKIRGGKLGHIEDIVVHELQRGRGIGAMILVALETTAISEGCYKLALQCKSENVPFYERCGYQSGSNGLHRLLPFKE